MLERTTTPFSERHAALFERDGVLVVDAMAGADEVAELTAILEPLFAGEIDAGNQRADFGDFDETPAEQEQITQIMQVHDFVPEALKTGHAARTLAAARFILGDDMELDMSMAWTSCPKRQRPHPGIRTKPIGCPRFPTGVRIRSGWRWTMSRSRAAACGLCRVPTGNRQRSRRTWRLPQASPTTAGIARLAQLRPIGRDPQILGLRVKPLGRASAC